MSTSALITAEQLLAMPDDGQRRELINGELTMMAPAGGGHGRVAMNIGARLHTYVTSTRMGVVLAAETGFVLSRDPDTVRAPDVAFISTRRIPAGGIPDSFIPFAPDLAVEVLSPDDRQVEVEEKTQQWLEAGTRAVWIVNTRMRTVTVHRNGADPRILRESDTLGGDIIPGLELKVADLFA